MRQITTLRPYLPAALTAGLLAALASSAALAGDPIIAPGQKAAQEGQQPPPNGSAAPVAPPTDPAAPATAAPTAPTAPPAFSAPSFANGAPPAPTGQPAATSSYPTHWWEMQAIDVTVPGKKATLREEERIGDYKQPRWTAKRRFPTTRVYVVPAGKMEFEWWFRWTGPFDNPVRGRELRTQWEFEMGLGHRLQLDLYLVGQQEGHNQFAITREKAELRYALADWGEIWGNPTLYLEYQHQSAPPESGKPQDAKPDTIEAKLLLGGELTSRWHAGFNLQWERELWGHEGNEYQVTGGVSYTVKDEVFHIGLEGYAELVDEMGSYGDFKEQSYLFGPSLMISPVYPANILIAPLFGAGLGDGKWSGIFQGYIITGWTF